MTPAELRALAERLTPCEQELLMGIPTSWGSWMWEAGCGLVAAGLADRRNGSIIINDLGDQVAASLRARAEEAPNG